MGLIDISAGTQCQQSGQQQQNTAFAAVAAGQYAGGLLIEEIRHPRPGTGGHGLFPVGKLLSKQVIDTYLLLIHESDKFFLLFVIQLKLLNPLP